MYSVWPPVSIVRTTTSPVFTPTRASTGIPPSARVRGWALAQQDRLEEGIAGMRRAFTASEAMRSEGSQLLCNGDLEA